MEASTYVTSNPSVLALDFPLFPLRGFSFGARDWKNSNDNGTSESDMSSGMGQRVRWTCQSALLRWPRTSRIRGVWAGEVWRTTNLVLRQVIHRCQGGHVVYRVHACPLTLSAMRSLFFHV